MFRCTARVVLTCWLNLLCTENLRAKLDFHCGCCSFRSSAHDELQHWEGEIASPVLFPAAGNLTERRVEKAAWIQHRMGRVAAGSEMQNKGWDRRAGEGLEEGGWTEIEKVLEDKPEVKNSTKDGGEAVGEKEGRGWRERVIISHQGNSVLCNSKLVPTFGIFFLPRKLLWGGKAPQYIHPWKFSFCMVTLCVWMHLLPLLGSTCSLFFKRLTLQP